MKDFYDLALLARTYPFDGKPLAGGDHRHVSAPRNDN
jgi:hypothetical protein